MRLNRASRAAVFVALAVIGTAEAATIVGTPQPDRLRGTAKADILHGRRGADTLYGLGGNDRLIPGPGRDRVFCGPGVDRVQADRLDIVANDCEIVFPAAGTTPPAPPAEPPPPPPPPPPVGSTRANPVPFGTAFPLGNGWTLTVSGTVPDATAIVLAENQFNDPPAPGAQFFIATITVTNVSSSETRFSYFDVRSVGGLDIPYASFTHSCGVIPNSFLFAGGEAFPGGTLTRNVCWQVATSDAGNLQMFWQPASGNNIFFALR